VRCAKKKWKQRKEGEKGRKGIEDIPYYQKVSNPH
jgi:hypothetical protein